MMTEKQTKKSSIVVVIGNVIFVCIVIYIFLLIPLKKYYFLHSNSDVVMGKIESFKVKTGGVPSIVFSFKTKNNIIYKGYRVIPIDFENSKEFKHNKEKKYYVLYNKDNPSISYMVLKSVSEVTPKNITSYIGIVDMYN